MHFRTCIDQQLSESCHQRTDPSLGSAWNPILMHEQLSIMLLRSTVNTFSVALTPLVLVTRERNMSCHATTIKTLDIYPQAMASWWCDWRLYRL